LFCFDFVID